MDSFRIVIVDAPRPTPCLSDVDQDGLIILCVQTVIDDEDDDVDKIAIIMGC